MNGTLALWYEPPDGEVGLVPRVEVHFNLWRDLDETGLNYLDVGFLFLKPQTESVADHLGRFFLYFPAVIGREQFLDLCPLMEQGKTLNAVFNDVVTISRTGEGSFEAKSRRGEPFQFHELQRDDVEFRTMEFGENQFGTIVIFRNSLCNRFRQATNHYVRVRFELAGATRNLFSTDVRPRDWFLLSSFFRTELTEFRLNERRSFPEAIGNRANHQFEFTTIHLFLIRHLRFELMQAHANFRKMRRLEEDLWKHYLTGRPPEHFRGHPIRRVLPRAAARHMLIYQWRMDATEQKPIDDFIAVAMFRSPISNLLFYAAVITFLGALGNAAYTLTVSAVQGIGRTAEVDTIGTWTTNIFAALLLLLLAFVVPDILRRLPRLLRSTSDRLQLWAVARKNPQRNASPPDGA